MNWDEFFREVARQGLTVTFSPAHFFGGTSGVKVDMADFDREEDLPSVYEIVRHDAINAHGGEAILAAACRLLQQLEADD